MASTAGHNNKTAFNGASIIINSVPALHRQQSLHPSLCQNCLSPPLLTRFSSSFPQQAQACLLHQFAHVARCPRSLCHLKKNPTHQNSQNRRQRWVLSPARDNSSASTNTNTITPPLIQERGKKGTPAPYRKVHVIDEDQGERKMSTPPALQTTTYRHHRAVMCTNIRILTMDVVSV